LLAGGDGDVEGGRNLGEAVDVIMLHRLLEPHVAELFERPTDADRALHGIAVVGVEGEREVAAHELAHGARLGDIAGEIRVARRLVGVEADLHLSGPELEPLLDHATHLIHAALAVASDRRVEGELAPPRAAQELPHGLAEDLAPEIPQRDVDGGQRARVGAFRSHLDVPMKQPVLDHARFQRVDAEQVGREGAGDDLE